MPSKYYNRNFKHQHYYHIFNRGAYKNKVFLDKEDYEAFLSILEYYLQYPRSKHFSYTKIVSQPYKNVKVRNLISIHLVAYCLMPNHFHLILKQLPSATLKTNISNLMRRLSITYAMYFQNKYKHAGALFEGKFKNVTVDSEEQLLYLSKYIHLNPTKFVKRLKDYQYSSYSNYINYINRFDHLAPDYVLKLQKNYRQFVELPFKEKEEKMIEECLLD